VADGNCEPTISLATLSLLSLRETKKQRQRETLERIALQLFATRGYEQTTVQAICEAAEVAHATFYRYFSTKGDVLFASRTRYVDALNRILDESPRVTGMSWRDVVVAFADVLSSDEMLATRDRVAQSNPRLLDQILALQREWEDTLARGLAQRRGLDEPDIETRLEAGAAMVILRAALRDWDENPGRAPLRTHVDRAMACWRSEFDTPVRQEAR